MPLVSAELVHGFRRLLGGGRDRFLGALPYRAALRAEFFFYHRRLPNLDRPETFNEKIQHRKLYERDPRLPALADKLLAKRRVSELLGADWVVPTLWSGEGLPSPEQRSWRIPFVLKASHGSGWNYFVRCPADADWQKIERRVGLWMASRYGGGTREWHYSQMTPRLLVEPFLGDSGGFPLDYKFFVFSGKVEFVQVDVGRYSDHRQFFFDRAWRRQPFEYAAPGGLEEPGPPPSLDRMLWAAERLGAGFPFVRIDLYELAGKPFFGEFTFFPNAGRVRFRPRRFDLELGKLWVS